MFFTKREIENIAEDRVNSLKENQVAEGKHLEYKINFTWRKIRGEKRIFSSMYLPLQIQKEV